MSMDDNMKQKILEQIEEQHLEPTPGWRFRLVRALKHSAVAFLFALTALGLAGSVYILVQNGTLDDLRLGPRWAHPAFFDFPWQLLVVVVVLGILSFVVLRRTARLYRLRNEPHTVYLPRWAGSGAVSAWREPLRRDDGRCRDRRRRLTHDPAVGRRQPYWRALAGYRHRGDLLPLRFGHPCGDGRPGRRATPEDHDLCCRHSPRDRHGRHDGYRWHDGTRNPHPRHTVGERRLSHPG